MFQIKNIYNECFRVKSFDIKIATTLINVHAIVRLLGEDLAESFIMSKNSRSMSLNEEKMTHVRRCHLCGSVNENEAAVITKCNQCGKHFVPFLFFNEKVALGIEIEQPDLRPQISNWQRLVRTQYPPLWGLAVYW